MVAHSEAGVSQATSKERPAGERPKRQTHCWQNCKGLAPRPTSLNPGRGSLPGPDLGGFRQCPKQTLELYTQKREKISFQYTSPIWLPFPFWSLPQPGLAELASPGPGEEGDRPAAALSESPCGQVPDTATPFTTDSQSLQ